MRKWRDDGRHDGENKEEDDDEHCDRRGNGSSAELEEKRFRLEEHQLLGVIAGKGQSITVVTTADESEEAKVMDADQACVTEEGKLREKKEEEEKDD
ncbi:uncharacterized protein MONOS_17096 [Monocercomonoides exilis]|uniref:uncharacterized protein n=1 Tax=Monocercomonoides exilis TaxID=2049356 RepID=UPI0035598EFD|nr:hypothetical protein MONOS_17096 [Monocercomonoides exilis]